MIIYSALAMQRRPDLYPEPSVNFADPELVGCMLDHILIPLCRMSNVQTDSPGRDMLGRKHEWFEYRVIRRVWVDFFDAQYCSNE